MGREGKQLGVWAVAGICCSVRESRVEAVQVAWLFYRLPLSSFEQVGIHPPPRVLLPAPSDRFNDCKARYKVKALIKFHGS